MAATKINLVDLDTAAKSIPADVPVAMLNLLKFKTQATYPEGSAHTNISGEQAYLTRYIPGIMEITSAWGEDSGASMKPLWVGKLQANMLAEPFNGKDDWDRIGIIWYPNFAAFRKLVESKEYAAGPLQHRHAALEDYRLYATVPWAGQT